MKVKPNGTSATLTCAWQSVLAPAPRALAYQVALTVDPGEASGHTKWRGAFTCHVKADGMELTVNGPVLI